MSYDRYKWRRQNPDRVRLHQAKALIRAATGLNVREIPDDLAEAKRLQLAIARWVKTANDT